MSVSYIYELECQVSSLRRELSKILKHLNESPHFCNCEDSSGEHYVVIVGVPMWNVNYTKEEFIVRGAFQLPSQNIYEYKKVKPLDYKELSAEALLSGDYDLYIKKALINKITELTIEQNHLMKDFELYKKAFKTHTHKDHHFTCGQ